ncbi:MAG: Copper-binding protein, nitrous oxidase accessory protein [Chloroflexi bacterium]|nr:Copper-binding protein, nitrous oxidase accessory protein [Chloroflexota bacterium]
MTGTAAARGPVELAVGRVSRRGWRGSPLVAPVLALAGAVALVVAGTLPIWGTTLQAPQYPKGLALWFYGGRAEGPVSEVNTLNHYIGMRPVDLAIVPELGLWPLAIVGCAAMLAFAIFVPGRLGRLAVLGLFLVPLGVLADIQRWLIIFGSELDTSSALRLDPFVPLVVGPSTVWNFTIWTYPGPALGLLWVAGVIALAARRATMPPIPFRAAVSIMVLVLATLGTLLFVIPAVRPPADLHAAGAGPPAGPVDLARLVQAAPAGATIVVPAGSYRVHLVIERPLTLVADGDVLLDGRGRGTIVTIGADDVTLRGFRLAHTGSQVEDGAAIKTLEASRVTIEGNTLTDFFTGISVNGGADVRIVGNVLTGSGQVASGAGHAAGTGAAASEPAMGDASGPRGSEGATAGADPHAGHADGAGPGGQGDGISIWTTVGVLIRENRIVDVRDAIYLNYAEEVLVDSNVVDRSRYAVHAMFGRTVTVFGNTARGNLSGLVFMNTTGVLAGRNALLDARSGGTGYGIVLKDVVGVRLAENVVARNRIGLQAEGTVHHDPEEALVVRNRFAGNDVGIALMATADLAFAANDFDGNLTQVLALEVGVERHNDWANGGTGNTWSDYPGFDLDADGIGDIPYTAGGAGEMLLAVAPALAAYRTSPALAVLDTARAVWESAREPVARDAFPRIHAVAVLADGTPAAGPAVPVPPLAGGAHADGAHAGHGAGAAPVGALAPGDTGTAPDAAGVLAAWRALGGSLLALAILWAAALRGDLASLRRFSLPARAATLP